ncbi:hypothetical protein CB0101_01485 [Synechococcus sp. CB0101]|uniref:hypothetical protein n=1 Tax=Synechococcus sp. CB0101 TaxID=232348 RepID=UPI0010AB023F|nr:hypothetical protein [Synechococcus sp. CB0101]QCH13781.1 hypothetical protein CB0101_01485 [Synechococcus sp. CB0101]
MTQNNFSPLATYVLNVDLIGVDSITGVIGAFSGKVRGKRGQTVFSQAETINGNSLEFRVRAKGDKLIGSFSFAADENASYTFGSQTFEFVNPGSKRVKIKAKEDEKLPMEEINISFNKIPRTGASDEFALQLDESPFAMLATDSMA